MAAIAATVQDEADELLTTDRIRIYSAAAFGPWPTVAATILSAAGLDSHGVTLGYGVWDCDRHHSSTCACVLAVQGVTTGASA